MASSNADNPAYQQLTASNHGPAIVVSSYIFLVIAIITVFTRLLTRFHIIRNFHLDDWLIVLAIVFSLLQTITLTISVNHGLGRHREAISELQFNAYTKAFYATKLLTIPIVLFAKISTNLLIIGINPPRKILMACRAVLAVTTAWALAIFFLVAFQCSLPTPWDYENERCMNQRAINIAGSVWNIVTDIILVVLPFCLMRRVQVSESKRWVVISLFACRIIVPAFTIAGIVTAKPIYDSPNGDITWYSTTCTIWLQGMISLSIVTACIPCIKRFLADMSTGMMTVNISEPLELTMKQTSSTGGDRTSKRTSDGGMFTHRSLSSRLFFHGEKISQTQSKNSNSIPGQSYDQTLTTVSTVSNSEKETQF